MGRSSDYTRKQLYSQLTCEELAEKLGDLSFYIQDSLIVLPPASYLYQVPAFENSTGLIDDEALSANETDPTIDAEEPEFTGNRDGSECRIGIESIPNTANHYRLGVSFLKHFYTSLDYENNLVAMALNSVAMEKEITIVKDPAGKLKPQPIPDDDYHALVTILQLGLMCIFFWLQILGVQYKRRSEPGYVPKVLRAGFMQRF